MIEVLDGNTETANEFLDFIAVKLVGQTGLKTLYFNKLRPSVTEIEPEILINLASKAKDLQTLNVHGHLYATKKVRGQLALMVQDIILLKPHDLQWLSLVESGISVSDGEKICHALLKSKITTLKKIFLTNNNSWFKTEKQCSSWAKVFSQQTDLKRLSLSCEGMNKNGL